MSGWDIYWLLKLDTFRITFLMVGFVLAAVSIAIGAAVMRAYSDLQPLNEKDKKEFNWLTKRLVCGLALGLLFLGANVLLPSTKQMAVITIGPKVATAENIEALGAESKEIYGLAKQWLKDQAGIKEKEKK